MPFSYSSSFLGALREAGEDWEAREIGVDSGKAEGGGLAPRGEGGRRRRTLPGLAIQPVGNGVQGPEPQEPEPIKSLRKKARPSRLPGSAPRPRPGGCGGIALRSRLGWRASRRSRMEAVFSACLREKLLGWRFDALEASGAPRPSCESGPGAGGGGGPRAGSSPAFM